MSDDRIDTPSNDSPDAAKPQRSRRAAARPAGPPVTAAPADSPAASVGATAAGARPAAKKSTAKKTTPKTAAAKGSDSDSADAGVSDVGKTAGAPAAAFLAPVFQPPQPKATAGKSTGKAGGKPSNAGTTTDGQQDANSPSGSGKGQGKPGQSKSSQGKSTAKTDSGSADDASAANRGQGDDSDSDGDDRTGGNRRRRGSRGRRGRGGTDTTGAEQSDETSEDGDEGDDEATGDTSAHRRRKRRRAGEADGEDQGDGATVVHVRTARPKDEVRGSVRMESRKQRRRDGRDNGRRRVNISEAEFLARRESVDRVMVVRDREGITQIGVLEDGILVEHYVTQAGSGSLIGNVYLGRVQNVLPSMEAVFIDIGRGRNGVLYAGEINWDLLGVTKSEDRRVENVLKSGDTIVVQVSKDPVGQKGARLTHMASIPGRYVVYVPNSSTTGISRKLPENERNRLKTILRGVLPEDGGVIVRTAAEGASEEELSRDVHRLLAQWEDITTKSKTAKAPAQLYSEPDMTIKVVRDIFNEDFRVLKVAGEDSYETLQQYIGWVAPDLLPRMEKWVETDDIFNAHRVDEQLAKALDRKVFLPSGGSLVIDRTEAMTVIDVNTGRFIGSGGNLEETVTKNNLEAAEEIVRQLRLRDIGGIIVVDFIDMVLESNRDAVLRRLVECLGRDRTKHQVAEVTSLGLVQMTRKRIGQGLLEVFSQPCDHCNGRGVRITTTPVPVKEDRADADRRKPEGKSDGKYDGKPDSGKSDGKSAGKSKPAGKPSGKPSGKSGSRSSATREVEASADAQSQATAGVAEEPGTSQADAFVAVQE